MKAETIFLLASLCLVPLAPAMAFGPGSENCPMVFAGENVALEGYEMDLLTDLPEGWAVQICDVSGNPFYEDIGKVYAEVSPIYSAYGISYFYITSVFQTVFDGRTTWSTHPPNGHPGISWKMAYMQFTERAPDRQDSDGFIAVNGLSVNLFRLSMESWHRITQSEQTLKQALREMPAGNGSGPHVRRLISALFPKKGDTEYRIIQIEFESDPYPPVKNPRFKFTLYKNIYSYFYFINYDFTESGIVLQSVSEAIE